MNRIESLFKNKTRDILSVYFTAGYPQLDSTVPIINTLAEQGIDLIEVGMPFSDPMADGPTIQESSSIALAEGMNMSLLFEQVAEARRQSPDIPLVLMGYLNPILRYGVERLFCTCSQVGIDGLIVPDLPFHEYMKDFRHLSAAHNIPMIMLITPETSPERIHLIDDNCDGFIYMVSAAATTGTRNNFDSEQLEYFHRVNAMNLRHPRLIGFGISNPVTLQSAWHNSSGAIVGSLFIKCLKRNPSIAEAVNDLRVTLGVAEKGSN